MEGAIFCLFYPLSKLALSHLAAGCGFVESVALGVGPPTLAILLTAWAYKFFLKSIPSSVMDILPAFFNGSAVRSFSILAPAFDAVVAGFEVSVAYEQICPSVKD